ncbi:MAG: MFS transporter [Oscillospiraceae bacterium]
MKNKENLKILIGSALIMGGGVGLLSSSVGIFVLPVTKALSLSRSAFLFVNSITIFMSLVFLPLAPAAFKKARPCKIVFLSGFVCALVSLCYSFSQSIYIFYILAAISGIFIGGISSPLIAPLLKNAYREKSEVYLAMAFTGSSLTSIIVVPLIRLINQSFGFKWGYRFIFLVGGSMCFLGGYLIRECKIPEKLNEFSFKEGFSIIKADKKILPKLLALFLGNLINLAIFNNLASFLGDLGFGERWGAYATSAIFAVMIFAKPLSGYVFNKKGAKAGCEFLSLWLFSASVSALLLNYSKIFLLPAILSLGFCGAFNSIPALSLAGEEKNPAAFTLFMLPGYLGSACGSLFAAFIFDNSKSYTPAWLIFSALSLVDCLIFALAAKQAPRSPSKGKKRPAR